MMTRKPKDRTILMLGEAYNELEAQLLRGDAGGPPSRRKAAAMERVRATAESLFWDMLTSLHARADAVAAIGDGKQRRADWRIAEAAITRTVLAAAVKAGLPESVAQGLAPATLRGYRYDLRHFLAWHEGMQAALDAGLVIETPYCTQQTGGLTRGITLRAIQTKAAIPRL